MRSKETGPDRKRSPSGPLRWSCLLMPHTAPHGTEPKLTLAPRIVGYSRLVRVAFQSPRRACGLLHTTKGNQHVSAANPGSASVVKQAQLRLATPPDRRPVASVHTCLAMFVAAAISRFGSPCSINSMFRPVLDLQFDPTNNCPHSSSLSRSTTRDTSVSIPAASIRVNPGRDFFPDPV